MSLPDIQVRLPGWVGDRLAAVDPLPDDRDRMRFVVELARENVRRDTGGPFAAAVIESASGRVLAAGVNLVLPLRSSVLHAEIVAIMMAQKRLDTHVLSAPGLPVSELVTSCEPCAMCLGALLWSGVRRVVTGATREDAEGIGFDEGPVFPESYAYLEARGIEIARGVEREPARDVLTLYAEQNKMIYNG